MPSITNIVRLFVAVAMAMIAVPLLLASSAPAVEEGKVGICHTTGSDSKPFVYIEVPEEEANGHITGTSSDHNAQHAWQSAGTWNGVPHAADELKMDYFANEEDAATNCGPRTPPTDECPDLDGDQPPGFQCEPDSDTETRDLGPLLDCVAGTITTLHQERSRIQTFDAEAQEWVFGAFSDWETVDTTVEDATEVDCPPGEPILPPAPPAPPVVNPPAPQAPPEAPTLPATGSPALLSGLALMGALLLAAGSTLFMRSRKVRVPKA